LIENEFNLNFGLVDFEERKLSNFIFLKERKRKEFGRLVSWVASLITTSSDKQVEQLLQSQLSNDFVNCKPDLLNDWELVSSSQLGINTGLHVGI